jgi:hypothetical protein
MKAPIQLLFTFLALCAGVLCVSPRAALADELTHAFRGGGWDETLFRPTGPNTLRALRVDSAGLRITLGKDRTNSVPVGLCTRFGVRGDFDITMTFQIVRIDKPTGGNGAGASIWVSMVSSTQDAAGLARLVRPDGEQVFLANRARTPAGQQRQYHGGNPLSTKTQSGKLRLVRKGAELTYLIAQSPTGPFHELYKAEWGAGDLDVVRFAADNGGSPGLVDVRIKDVSIRADDFGSARPAPPPSRHRSVWWLAGALLVSAAIIGFWWRQRRSNR